MKNKRFIYAIGLLLGLPAGAASAQSGMAYLSEPLTRGGYTADPAAHVFNGRIYVYASHDTLTAEPAPGPGGQFDIRATRLLVMDRPGAKARDAGDVLQLKDIPWAERLLWAPDAAAANGKYYLYFPAKDKQGVFRIGVASASSPEGPFKAEKQPIKGTYSIDPCIFKDDDGKHYLYFGGIWGGQLQQWDEQNRHHPDAAYRQGNEPAVAPRMARLGKDMKSLAESVRPIVLLSANGQPYTEAQNEERFFEAPWVFKREGVYYLTYSTCDTHKICYATGNSPYGPFTYRGVLLNPVSGWTNHQSVLAYEGQWYLFYHDMQLSGKDNLRNVKMSPLQFNADGSIATLTAQWSEQTSTAEAGVRFEKGSFAQILQKAKAEGKYVMIDAFTTWCAPCKYMDQNVYPTKEAGEFFNANFINAAFDMEKGEGIDLLKRYQVHAFPTFLFVDGDGKLVHRFSGGMDVNSFIAASKEALDPATQYVTRLNQYEQGNKAPAFVYDLAYTARKAGDDSIANVLKNQYLRSQRDSLSTANAQMLFDFTEAKDPADFAYMLRHAETFRQAVGAERYDQKTGELAYAIAFAQSGIGNGLSKEKAPAAIAAGKAYLEKTVPAQSEKMTHRLAVNAYGQSGDMDGYAAEMVNWYTKYPSSNPDELNALAWNFFQNVDNKTYLATALQWALTSVKQAEGYGNLDTVANLYHKLGDDKNARVYAQKAIARGKEDGQDVSSTEKMLAELK